jgi:hypothetical protein
MSHWSSLAETIYRRGLPFRSPAPNARGTQVWDGGTKYLQAQLSIAYATDVMAFDSRDFMSNECPNVECRFEIFLRWITNLV